MRAIFFFRRRQAAQLAPAVAPGLFRWRPAVAAITATQAKFGYSTGGATTRKFEGGENMTRKTEILRLMDLAEGKGFSVTRSTIRDRWRLIDREGNTVRKRDSNLAAFTVREALKFLETIPDPSAS